MKKILFLFIALIFQGCVYEQYSTAIIKNNTDNLITIKLHLDTVSLKSKYWYKQPIDAFEYFKKSDTTEKFKIDSTNNLSGTIILKPNQTLRLYEHMTYKPELFVDKIFISYYSKSILLENKIDIEKAFIKKDKGIYELNIE